MTDSFPARSRLARALVPSLVALLVALVKVPASAQDTPAASPAAPASAPAAASAPTPASAAPRSRVTVLPPIDIAGRVQRPIFVMVGRSSATHSEAPLQTSHVGDIVRSVDGAPF